MRRGYLRTNYRLTGGLLDTIAELDFGDEAEYSGEVSFEAGEQGVRKTLKILRAYRIDLDGRLFNLIQSGLTSSHKTDDANIRAMVFFVFRTTPLALGADFRVDEVDSAGATAYMYTTNLAYTEDTTSGASLEGQDNAEIGLNQRIYLYIGLAAQLVPNTAQSGTVYCRRVYFHGMVGRLGSVRVIG